MKVLVVRFSSIGDIVLTTPVIRCLKTQVPGLELHFLTKARFADLLSGNPYIDKAHLLDKNGKVLKAALKQEGFDHIIDLHHNLRTMRLRWALSVPTHAFNKLNYEKWLLVNFRINHLPTVHIVDRYLDTAKFLGVQNDGQGLDFFIPDHVQLPETFTLPDKFTALCIGGQFNTKRMPLNKLKEVCAAIPTPLVILGGKEDAANGSRLEKQFPHVINGAGKLSLLQSARVIERASHVITHDTGLMHIAAAMRKPVLSVWGNTIPGFGMTPYFPQGHTAEQQSAIFEVEGLSCRPCSKLGHRKCPRRHFKCMNMQSAEKMAAHLAQIS